MPDPRDNARGILAMNAAMAAFIVNDSLLKSASDLLPLGEMLAVRGAVATALLLALAWWTGALRAVRHLANRIILYRIVGEIGASLFFISGMIQMPLGNATAIFQVTPLAVTAGAALFLGETVGWRRWTAIMVGFAGVLLIVRPGLEGFDRTGLLILASVGFVVLRDLATSKMPQTIPTSLAALTTAAAMMLAGFCLMPIEGLFSRHETWQPIDPVTLAKLAGAGAVLVLGYLALTVAMRSGEMAVVAPFRYVLLVWSFLIGAVFFGERPDWVTLLGAVIVVGTGLYSFGRERIRQRDRALKSAVEPLP